MTHDGHEASEDGHGRHEERYVTVVYDPAGLPPDWPGVAAVVQVTRVREAGGRRAETTHYYLTSHRGTAKELGDRVRGHWAIEAMHGVLDVAFREDESRTRAGHAGANLGMIRRVAVSLLKRADAKGEHPHPEADGRLGRRVSTQSRPGHPGNLNAFALRSADGGNTWGMFKLGWMYFTGRGVKRNDVEGLRWIRMSADKGNRYGMSNLGWAFEYGRGTPRDLAKAEEWYRESLAAGGDPVSVEGLKRLGKK